MSSDMRGETPLDVRNPSRLVPSLLDNLKKKREDLGNECYQLDLIISALSDDEVLADAMNSMHIKGRIF